MEEILTQLDSDIAICISKTFRPSLIIISLCISSVIVFVGVLIRYLIEKSSQKGGK